MSRWRHAFPAAMLLMTGLAAQAATVTLSPGSGLQAAIHSAAEGDIIELNPGVYTPSTSGSWSEGNAFGINKRITVRGVASATASQVILRGGSGSTDYAVKFVALSGFFTPNSSTLQNLTIDTSNGGILVRDYATGTRLQDITIKDVVINTPFANPPFGAGNGVLAMKAQRLVLDNVAITAYQAGINFIDVTNSVVMNSTVVSTVAPGAPGLSVYGGSDNTFVGNTIGSPKTGSTYSFNAGGVVFYNSISSRFENNTVQGHRDDGLDYSAIDMTGNPDIPASEQVRKSTDHYVGKNNVIATGFADGRPAGSGIWANCSSDNTWLYGNDSRGTAEQGIVVFTSRSNMLLGNHTHNNAISGVFVTGYSASLALCPIASFRVKPSSTFLQSNEIYYNKNDQIVVRSADETEISRNFLSPRNGFGGALQTCPSVYCQAAFALEGESSTPQFNSTGFRVLANTSLMNTRGIQGGDNGFYSGLDFALNRMMHSLAPPDNFSRYISGPINIDRGDKIGGSYWTQHSTATGNPSAAGTPYNGVYATTSNATGIVVDRFPYKSEDLGRGAGAIISEPRAGFSFAQGTRRTVRWNAPGCVHVDLLLDGVTSLAANVGNTGYRVVTIPVSAAVGAHNIMVQCRDSAGTLKGQSTSSNFNVTGSSLQLVAPGRDDVFNAGTAIWVAWKKAASIVSVIVELSVDGGATFPYNLGTFTGTAARVTLPVVTSTAYAVMRVRSGTAIDYTDGVFAIRGASGAGFTATNVPAGRTLVMGNLERLEWASPQNSRVVSITAQVGANPVKTVATNLPDRGSYDWIVPDLGGAGNVTLSITFKQTDGSTTISTATNSNAISRYATTITFGATSTLSIGASQVLTATSNSGQTITFTSQTPSVCSVIGSSVSGTAAGTCTVAATTTANATYAAGQASVSFLVSSNPPRLVNIATRGQVFTGDNVMIGGFAISGSSAKTVLILARGPSLADAGVPNTLPNPRVTLVSMNTGLIVDSNDDWGSAANAAAIAATGKAPTRAVESAILISLTPGNYTAVVDGGPTLGTGNGIVEVYEIDQPETPLVNIATRGQVLTGDNVMIGGFAIRGDGPLQVLVVARGPSLADAGVPNTLPNPRVTLVNQATGLIVAYNDDWGTASNAAAITATGKAPTRAVESAILISLDPGNYTAIVDGGPTFGTGNGIIEVYKQ